MNQPLPELRLRLLSEDKSIFALDDHKEIAKVRGTLFVQIGLGLYFISLIMNGPIYCL